MSTASATPLAHGRSCEVFALGADRVVKLSLPGIPAAEVEREIRDSIVVHELGLTPLRCYGPIEQDGRRGIVFDRMEGVALTSLAERNPLRLPAVGRMLGAEHARVHAAQTDRLQDVRALAGSLVDAAPLDALDAAERETLRERIAALPVGRSVLHLDFHPQNVFDRHGERIVIDWQSAAVGPSFVDVAMTRFLFTEAELFPGISAWQRTLYGALRRLMFRFYLSEYRARTGMTDADIDRGELAALTVRLALLDVASERTWILGRIRTLLAEPPR